MEKVNKNLVGLITAAIIGLSTPALGGQPGTFDMVSVQTKNGKNIPAVEHYEYDSSVKAKFGQRVKDYASKHLPNNPSVEVEINGGAPIYFTQLSDLSWYMDRFRNDKSDFIVVKYAQNQAPRNIPAPVVAKNIPEPKIASRVSANKPIVSKLTASNLESDITWEELTPIKTSKYNFDIDGDFKPDSIEETGNGSYLLNGRGVTPEYLLSVMMDNFGNVDYAGVTKDNLDTLYGINLFNQIIKNGGDVTQVEKLFANLAYKNKLNMADLLMGAGDIGFSRRGAELIAQGADMNHVASFLATKKSFGRTYLEAVLNPIGSVYNAFNDFNILGHTAVDDAVIKYASAVEIAKSYLEARSQAGFKIEESDIRMVFETIYNKGVNGILGPEKKKILINYGGN